MAIAYPSALLIAGARAFLDSYWVENEGRLPPSLEQIFTACYARTEAERAAVVIALHDYHPEVADIYLSKDPHLWHANTATAPEQAKRKGRNASRG